MLRMGTDSLSVLLRLCRLLNPSSISRRSTRSSTRDWEMPKSSKVCGMGGLNPLWAGESVAAMKDIEPHSLYRPNRDICLLADGMGLHACGSRTVNPLVKVCWSIVLLLIGCWIPLSAASQAEQLFHQAQKAE